MNKGKSPGAARYSDTHLSVYSAARHCICAVSPVSRCRGDWDAYAVRCRESCLTPFFFPVASQHAWRSYLLDLLGAQGASRRLEDPLLESFLEGLYKGRMVLVRVPRFDFWLCGAFLFFFSSGRPKTWSIYRGVAADSTNGQGDGPISPRSFFPVSREERRAGARWMVAR